MVRPNICRYHACSLAATYSNAETYANEESFWLEGVLIKQAAQKDVYKGVQMCEQQVSVDTSAICSNGTAVAKPH